MLRLYNTLTRSVEDFNTIEPKVVKAYFCGPTPYDYTHLGHIRSYIAFDFLKRFLQINGYSFYHVQNITDIDDKIIDRSRREGVSWRDIADRYTRDYLDNLRSFNIHIDLHPRVTDHIGDIIDFIQTLIDKGHAYVAPSGSVYFDVSTYSDYGRLSGKRSRDLWRQEEEHIREKKNPFDFALWKAAKPGEPTWDSPWGPGRPGWHIECSVMSSRYLGDSFDLHGGGQDLIFPHHENERAQSEARFGKSPWVRFWFHIGYLTISGEKMSKSLGNIITVREALKRWSPETIRLWVFSAHYRKPLEYKESSLEQAYKTYRRIIESISMLNQIVRRSPVEHKLSDEDIDTWNRISAAWNRFYGALSNDLNTPEALAELHELLTLINSRVVAKESSALALKSLSTLELMVRAIGLSIEFPDAVRSVDSRELEGLIDLIVEVRSRLRAMKLYSEADWIREQLKRFNIKLIDYRDRTRWIREEMDLDS